MKVGLREEEWDLEKEETGIPGLTFKVSVLNCTLAQEQTSVPPAPPNVPQEAFPFFRSPNLRWATWSIVKCPRTLSKR